MYTTTANNLSKTVGSSDEKNQIDEYAQLMSKKKSSKGQAGDMVEEMLFKDTSKNNGCVIC